MRPPSPQRNPYKVGSQDWRGFAWALSVRFGFGGHGIRVEVEPFNGLESRGVNAHVLDSADEVEDIASTVTFTETVPDIFTDTHAELCRVLPSMDRAGATKAISTLFEALKEAIMLEDLLHGDGRFDGLEVNKR